MVYVDPPKTKAPRVKVPRTVVSAKKGGTKTPASAGRKPAAQSRGGKRSSEDAKSKVEAAAILRSTRSSKGGADSTPASTSYALDSDSDLTIVTGKNIREKRESLLSILAAMPDPEVDEPASSPAFNPREGTSTGGVTRPTPRDTVKRMPRAAAVMKVDEMQDGPRKYFYFIPLLLLFFFFFHPGVFFVAVFCAVLLVCVTLVSFWFTQFQSGR